MAPSCDGTATSIFVLNSAVTSVVLQVAVTDDQLHNKPYSSADANCNWLERGKQRFYIFITLKRGMELLNLSSITAGELSLIKLLS